jgi:GNAT superfamily N-acetyltransferase
MLRLASFGDIPHVENMIEDFITEINSDLYRFDREKVGAILGSLVEEDAGDILVYERDGRIIGFILCTAQVHPILGYRMAMELAYYVAKEYRGSSAAVRLIQGFEQWAETKDVEAFALADIHVLEDLGPMYNRLGYTLVEKSYIKKAYREIKE